MTISQILFVRLVIETAKYLRMKEIPFADDAQSKPMHVQRGLIRGMALAITKMYGNGYEPYWAEEVKDAEKKAVRLAKEIVRDVPEHASWPADEWWLERRDRFWRSRSDAGA